MSYRRSQIAVHVATKGPYGPLLWLWIGLGLAVLISLGLPISARAQEWSAPEDLSQSPAPVDEMDWVADAAGRLHVVWAADGQLVHMVGQDAEWSVPTVIALGGWPSLAASSDGSIVLACIQSLDDIGDVYVMNWAPASGWGLALNLSLSDQGAESPCIVVADAGSLAVAWSEPDESASAVFVARSEDGQDWQVASVPNAAGTHPQVVFSSSGLVVAWEEALDSGYPLEIFASIDDGLGWSLPQDVSASFDEPSAHPALASGPTETWLLWEEGPALARDLAFSRLDGDVWDAPAAIPGSTNGQHPDLAFEGSAGYATWGTGSAAWICPLGADPLWGSVQRVATTDSAPSAVHIAIVDGIPHVAWLTTDGKMDQVYYGTLAEPEPVMQRIYLPMIW